ncbi:unnamed protein product [Heligmosomoides polygyrus]|uniref:Reverse transcriptase domain-containing protein n=1 Tax=Heligmosomoides polygyrus TaxID=6339 RepID=A0A183FZI0_HELPZ|nr:unnamed protein product [Heligmosomoides polygyrus]
MEFPHSVIPSVASVHGAVHKITVQETEEALRKMKGSKATGMDATTRDLGPPVPWTLLYADDVMLAWEDSDDLEHQVQAWCGRLAIFGSS